MTNTEMQQEALQRARDGASVTNYPAIYAGFAAMGIAEADIKPRENVLTFQAWKAVGRSVKKGQHGVRVTTFIEVGASEDPATGEKTPGYRKPHTTVVFHISQTEPSEAYEARRAAAGSNGGARRGRYRRRGYDAERRFAAAGHHITSAEHFVRNPGELAADRWNETHGDRWIEE